MLLPALDRSVEPANEARWSLPMVWLLCGSAAALGGGCATRSHYPVTKATGGFVVEAETPSGVPAVAPDSTPAWFAHDSSWIEQRSVLKRVVLTIFRSGTDVAQRKAAIDSVGGRVVGGHRGDAASDGYYFVEIPSAVSLDALANADVLRRQPVVEYANTYFALSFSEGAQRKETAGRSRARKRCEAGNSRALKLQPDWRGVPDT